MTHNELLAKINYYTVCTQPTKPEMVCDNEHLKEIYPEWFALRAVVELHKPETITTPCPDGKPGCLVLHYSDKQKCSCGFWNYPCPTIQAIEKELK